MNTDKLKIHCLTSDFTINSLACDINGKIYDFTGGIDDIKHKTLRFVGKAKDRINEDLLRILRGIRFLLKYDLKVDDETDRLLIDTDLSSLPVERIRDELIKILSLDLNLDFLNYLHNYLPKELTDDSMFEYGGKYHDECPHEHCENAFLEASKITGDWKNRLAALFHDIGKGVTRTEEWVDDGNEGDPIKVIKETNNDVYMEIPETAYCEKETHFYQHHKIGAEITRKWMEKMKFSKADTDFVSEMVYNHMFGYNNKDPSKRTYIKFFNNLEKANITIEDFLVQGYADNQGNMAKPRIKFMDFLKGNILYKKYYELKYSREPFNIKDLVVSGKDLIERYGLEPGPIFGEILNDVLSKIMDGDLKNERADIFAHINLLMYYINKIKESKKK